MMFKNLFVMDHIFNDFESMWIKIFQHIKLDVKISSSMETEDSL